MKDTYEICPNLYNINAIKSKKIQKIAVSMGLRNKLKLFLLFNSKNIENYFNLSSEEVQEFKENFFNIDDLVKNGKLYIIEYLNETDQKELLSYYLEGEDFCKVKFGLIDDEATLQKVLRTKTIKEALNSTNLEEKIKCIRSVPEKIVESDEIIDFINDKNNQI